MASSAATRRALLDGAPRMVFDVRGFHRGRRASRSRTLTTCHSSSPIRDQARVLDDVPRAPRPDEPGHVQDDRRRGHGSMAAIAGVWRAPRRGIPRARRSNARRANRGDAPLEVASEQERHLAVPDRKLLQAQETVRQIGNAHHHANAALDDKLFERAPGHPCAMNGPKAVSWPTSCWTLRRPARRHTSGLMCSGRRSCAAIVTGELLYGALEAGLKVLTKSRHSLTHCAGAERCT